jgi:hypothetical protein
MKIRMLRSAPGSVDGIRVGMYEVDQEYDLSTSAGAVDLAQSFVGAGLAEKLGASPAEPVVAEAGNVGAAEHLDAAGIEQPTTPAKPSRKPKAP